MKKEGLTGRKLAMCSGGHVDRQLADVISPFICPTHRNPLRLHVMCSVCAHPQHEGRSWGCPHVSKGTVLAGGGEPAGWCGHGDAAVNPTALRASSCYAGTVHPLLLFSRDVAVQELHLVLTFLIPIPYGGRVNTLIQRQPSQEGEFVRASLLSRMQRAPA